MSNFPTSIPAMPVFSPPVFIPYNISTTASPTILTESVSHNAILVTKSESATPVMESPLKTAKSSESSTPDGSINNSKSAEDLLSELNEVVTITPIVTEKLEINTMFSPVSTPLFNMQNTQTPMVVNITPMTSTLNPLISAVPIETSIPQIEIRLPIRGCSFRYSIDKLSHLDKPKMTSKDLILYAAESWYPTHIEVWEDHKNILPLPATPHEFLLEGIKRGLTGLHMNYTSCLTVFMTTPEHLKIMAKAYNVQHPFIDLKFQLEQRAAAQPSLPN
jgi:hypothetical protein